MLDEPPSVTQTVSLAAGRPPLTTAYSPASDSDSAGATAPEQLVHRRTVVVIESPSRSAGSTLPTTAWPTGSTWKLPT